MLWCVLGIATPSSAHAYDASAVYDGAVKNVHTHTNEDQPPTAGSAFDGLQVSLANAAWPLSIVFAKSVAADSGVWSLPSEGGGLNIGGLWYTEHALERIAPNTPEVMAQLEARAIARA